MRKSLLLASALVFLAGCASSLTIRGPSAQSVGTIFAIDDGRPSATAPSAGQSAAARAVGGIVGEAALSQFYPRGGKRAYFIRVQNGYEITVFSQQNLKEGQCVVVRYAEEQKDFRYFAEGEAELIASNVCHP